MSSTKNLINSNPTKQTNVVGAPSSSSFSSSNNNNNNNKDSIASSTRTLMDHVHSVTAQTISLQASEKTMVGRINTLKNDILTKQTQLRNDETKERTLRLHLQELNFNCETNKKRVLDAIERNKKSRAEEPVLYHLRKDEKKEIEEKNKNWMENGVQKIQSVENHWMKTMMITASNLLQPHQQNHTNTNNNNNNKDKTFLVLQEDEAPSNPSSSSSSSSSSKLVLIRQLQKQIEDRKNKQSELMKKITIFHQQAKELDENEIPQIDRQIKKLQEDEKVDEENKKEEHFHQKNEVFSRKELLKNLFFLLSMTDGKEVKDVDDENEKEEENDNDDAAAAATVSSSLSSSLTNRNNTTKSKNNKNLLQQISKISSKFQKTILHPIECDLSSLSEKQTLLQINLRENLKILKNLKQETANGLHCKNEELCQNCCCNNNNMMVTTTTTNGGDEAGNAHNNNNNNNRDSNIHHQSSYSSTTFVEED